MGQRALVILSAIWLCLCTAGARAAEPTPEIPAKAYLLMDAGSGQILLEHEADQPLPIASTTKIMTAILALERGDLSDVVTSGKKPYNTGGTTIYLEIGEQMTLQNLLYALLLESANDAAVAIAEHLAGSEERFADWMNQKAVEIGARHTRFVNSHGLHDPSHYSTARDLALIARYAMQNETFRRIVAVEETEIPGYKENPPRSLYNLNRLLGYYEGSNGVKNGFTEQAGLTNVASARRGETELIAVVLGAENFLWTSSMKLMDYGFTQFRTDVGMRRGDFVGTYPVPGADPVGVVAGDDLRVLTPVGGSPPERRLVWDEHLVPPVAAGARVGRAELVRGGAVLAAVDLITNEAAAAPVERVTAPIPEEEKPSMGYNQIFMMMGVIMLLAMLSFVMRRRQYMKNRRKQRGGSGKPAGRDRLHQIRDRHGNSSRRQ